MDRLIKKVVLLLASMSIVLGISGCVFNQKNVIDEVNNAGYYAEASDDGSFFINDNGADYYFITKNGKPSFTKVVIYLPARKPSAFSHGVDADLTMRKINWRKMDIVLNDPYFATKKDGSEELEYNRFYFSFKHDFEVENLTNNAIGFIDNLDHYKIFNNDYLSPTELKDYYDRGFELEEELREAIK